MKRQNTTKTQDIVVMYRDRHLTLRQIGAMIGMTAPGVAKRLKAAGVTANDGEWVRDVCCECGKEIQVTRCKWRKSARHYCSEACYYKARSNQDYKPNRYGQMVARKKVSLFITLIPGYVVHHKDGDEANNEYSNLAVYASNADHIRVHHGLHPVEPIWDGAQLARPAGHK